MGRVMTIVAMKASLTRNGSGSREMRGIGRDGDHLTCHSNGNVSSRTVMRRVIGDGVS